VTDGLSNTIVFGEDSAPDQLGIEWPAWAISQSEYQAGFTTDHPIENPQAAGRYWMRVLFDASAVSSHTGFGVFCFADGSVRSIVTSVDAHVYLALGGIQDGDFRIRDGLCSQSTNRDCRLRTTSHSFSACEVP
jgi:hypothetical protein